MWYSDLFDRTIHARWLSQGARRFQERLREQTQKAMEHKPEPLPQEIVREVERMAQHWEGAKR